MALVALRLGAGILALELLKQKLLQRIRVLFLKNCVK
jgi:hypothetical protein